MNAARAGADGADGALSRSASLADRRERLASQAQRQRLQLRDEVRLLAMRASPAAFAARAGEQVRAHPSIAIGAALALLLLGRFGTGRVASAALLGLRAWRAFSRRR